MPWLDLGLCHGRPPACREAYCCSLRRAKASALTLALAWRAGTGCWRWHWALALALALRALALAPERRHWRVHLSGDAQLLWVWV